MTHIPPHLKVRIAQIKLLAIDSDGVLTDGGVYVDEAGNEFRKFNIKDGLGLKRVMKAGIHVAIISGSTCQSVYHRARTLGIEEVHLGVLDKLQTLTTICEQLDIKFNQVAYIGDDLPDLPVIEAVELSFAPKDAVSQVRDTVDVVSDFSGGNGVVRQICELILIR